MAMFKTMSIFIPNVGRLGKQINLGGFEHNSQNCVDVAFSPGNLGFSVCCYLYFTLLSRWISMRGAGLVVVDIFLRFLTQCHLMDM